MLTELAPKGTNAVARKRNALMQDANKTRGAVVVANSRSVVRRWRDDSRGGVERAFTMVELEEAADEATKEKRKSTAPQWVATRVEVVWARPSGEVSERRLLWSVPA